MSASLGHDETLRNRGEPQVHQPGGLVDPAHEELIPRINSGSTSWPSPWSGPRLHGLEPDTDKGDLDEAVGVHEQVAAHLPTERVLGVVAVAMISFFNVSGGPIGSEQIISAGGPAIGLASLAGMWLCFAVPQALVTAELSSAYPLNGGYSLWVETAFGPFWGIQESYWSWCSGVVDNALYPVLLYSSLCALFNGTWGDLGDAGGSGEEEDLPNLWGCITTGQCARAYLAKLLITLVFTVPNVLSVNLVGQGLQVLCVLVLLPYLVLSLLALTHVDAARWSERTADGAVDWPTLLSVLYWNMSGWDCASTFAGEVKDPGRTFPRGLGLALLLMLVAYALPLLAASGCAAGGDWREWSEGSFAAIGQGIGGSWLGILIVASSALGSWGLFASELLEDSYQLLGMAEAGMAPRVFARRHPTLRTPVNAIMLQLVLIAVLIGFDFNSILNVDNFFSATQALLEFAACIKLRMSHAHVERPFRVPLSTCGMVLMLVVPSLLTLVTAYLGFVASAGAAAVNSLAVLGGIGLYLLFRGKCGSCLGVQLRRAPTQSAANGLAQQAPASDADLRELLLSTAFRLPASVVPVDGRSRAETAETL